MSVTAPVDIGCECGSIRGRLDLPRGARIARCYCRDCQAFAHYLKRAPVILDEQGGTLIVQSEPRRLTFSQGREKLACIRLTGKGMFRWYAACCSTAIGNTMPGMGFAFVGVIHDCIQMTVEQLTAQFGPVSFYANTHSAIGTPKPRQRGLLPAILGVSWQLLRGRLDGGYRITPFFDPATGEPVARPHVLTAAELASVKPAAN